MKIDFEIGSCNIFWKVLRKILLVIVCDRKLEKNIKDPSEDHIFHLGLRVLEISTHLQIQF